VANVVGVTGHNAAYVFREMPLESVFAYEHHHYASQGWECEPYFDRFTDLLDDLGV
jgi:hypothetical protein